MNGRDPDGTREGSDLSPYASAGPALVARGYSAIPISPANKMPGRFSGAEWWPMKDWSRYCAALPTGFEVTLWSKWPEANVGVAMGRGVLAFDIDQDFLIDPIKAVLPPCVVAKRGRKGETLFFRGDTSAIRSRGFKRQRPGSADPRDREGMMDLIADGKQTVVPPSIHPDTAAPYVWTTDRTLRDTPPADLTEITVEHVEAVIEVLRAHGYEAPETILPVEARGIEVGDAATSTAEWFRKLNEDALADLHAWVPRLGLTRLQRSGSGYRSVAEWRPSTTGKPLHKRNLYLSIDPKGIVDYGDCEKGYTALNLVMVALGIPESDLTRAAVWLGEAIGYDFAPKMVLNRNRPKLSPRDEAARLYRMAQETDEPAPAPVAAAEPAAPATDVPSAPTVPADEPPPAEVPATVIEFPETDDAPPPRTYEEEMRDLVEGVPGLVGDLVEWMRITSRTPNPVLAFAASVAFVGTLAGRNYEAPTDARTNFYTIGLAPSGFGKDHARKVIGHIVDRGGLRRFMGGEQIMSGSALRKRVEAQPSCLFRIDEFGGFMRDINNQKNQHSFQIRADLLKFFSEASGTFDGVDYAGSLGTPIHNPNVCIYGTSTPADFWASCRALSVADGLLARMLIFSVGGELPPIVRAAARTNEPPEALIRQCQHLTKPKTGGNLNGLLSDGSTSCKALLAPWADAPAEDYFCEVEDEFRHLGFEQGEEEGGLWNRTAEHALKLALVIEVGREPDRPRIHRGTLELARRIVELSTLMTLDQIAGRLADNDRQREHVDVKRWIMEAGADGVSRTAISKRVNGRFDRRRLDDILKSLEEDSREIVCVMTRPSGAGRPGQRYYSVKVLDGHGAA
ncbi:bifunctional DNA primase/polymerase [Methylorubrum populi]